MVDSSHAAASDEEEAEGMSEIWIVSPKSHLPDWSFNMWLPAYHTRSARCYYRIESSRTIAF